VRTVNVTCDNCDKPISGVFVPCVVTVRVNETSLLNRGGSEMFDLCIDCQETVARRLMHALTGDRIAKSFEPI